MYQFSPKKRHRARCFALQALYQWQLTDNDPEETMIRFVHEMNARKNDTDYFRDLVRGVTNNCSRLDTVFAPYLDRDINALGPVELSILRAATYEILWRAEMPYRVVINEAVELAKTFAAEEAHKYINAVIDKVAAKERAREVCASH